VEGGTPIEADGSMGDEHRSSVIECRSPRARIWHSVGGPVVSIIGGVAMLLGSWFVSGTARAPLLISAGVFLAAGLIGVRLRRRIAREVRLNDGIVTFTFLEHRTLAVPVDKSGRSAVRRRVAGSYGRGSSRP